MSSHRFQENYGHVFYLLLEHLTTNFTVYWRRRNSCAHRLLPWQNFSRYSLTCNRNGWPISHFNVNKMKHLQNGYYCCPLLFAVACICQHIYAAHISDVDAAKSSPAHPLRECSLHINFSFRHHH